MSSTLLPPKKKQVEHPLPSIFPSSQPEAIPQVSSGYGVAISHIGLGVSAHPNSGPIGCLWLLMAF